MLYSGKGRAKGRIGRHHTLHDILPRVFAPLKMVKVPERLSFPKILRDLRHDEAQN